ncbi:MAG: deoxyribodipyrimidine photo-lyase [Anaerolineae bacterium]|nr:deoxyribodipyrimidine photo-lyase [Anaerolineae bacterium]
MTVLHWFRRDLRLTDNRALAAALTDAKQTGETLIPVFVLDSALLDANRAGGTPRAAFMRNALISLDTTLRARGSHLVMQAGDPAQIIPHIVAESGARVVYANRDYSPYARHRDAAVQAALGNRFHLLDDALLIAPEQIATQNDTPYTVYTPFKKTWWDIPKAAPDEQPYAFSPLPEIASDSIPDASDPRFATTLDLPEASETAAQQTLADFIAGPIFNYGVHRDQLAVAGTSRLSPYLRFGLLSIRVAYAAAQQALKAAPDDATRQSVATWISELAWREFYTHIMFHFPHVMHGNFRREYDDLQWHDDPAALNAWKMGQTGYPVVDAGMRQLWQTGWMHNRARMITTSFLTKDLLIDWRAGERHFMQHLIDGDPAANNGGWQWSAGTGTDAQPYFRIFNPVTQSKKFDPDGTYIRRWVTELRNVPTRFIHTPWQMDAPPAAYPPPIVNHAAARERTLAAFKIIKD